MQLEHAPDHLSRCGVTQSQICAQSPLLFTERFVTCISPRRAAVTINKLSKYI